MIRLVFLLRINSLGAAMSQSRLMMLGLDAVSLPFIQDNLDSFPNLKTLLDRDVQQQGQVRLQTAGREGS